MQHVMLLAPRAIDVPESIARQFLGSTVVFGAFEADSIIGIREVGKACGALSVSRCKVSQCDISAHSPQCAKPCCKAHWRIGQRWSQYGVLTPSTRHPMQWMSSGRMSAWLSALHFCATRVRRALSLCIVAVRASHEAQSRPQKAIKGFILFTIYKFTMYDLTPLKSH